MVIFSELFEVIKRFKNDSLKKRDIKFIFFDLCKFLIKEKFTEPNFIESFTTFVIS